MTAKDPKHRPLCRKNAFVASYALFSDNKCPLFTRLGGGVRRKGTMSPFLPFFLYRGSPYQGYLGNRTSENTFQYKLPPKPGEDHLRNHFRPLKSVFWPLLLIKRRFSHSHPSKIFCFLHIPIRLFEIILNRCDTCPCQKKLSRYR